jgi:hypothetical protein
VFRNRKPDEDPRAPAYEFVFGQAARALTEQAQTLQDLRNRTGVLIAAAALITGFLGQPALDDGVLGFAGRLALLVFFAEVELSLLILWPVTGWYSVFQTPKLLTDYLEADEPASMPEMHRELALHMDNGRKGNGRMLRKRHRILAVTVLLLGAEVVLWAVEIAPQLRT